MKRILTLTIALVFLLASFGEVLAYDNTVQPSSETAVTAEDPSAVPEEPASSEEELLPQEPAAEDRQL